MTAPRVIAEVCADTAWQQYEIHSQRVQRGCRGESVFLFDDSVARAREWLGIALACEVAALGH